VEDKILQRAVVEVLNAVSDPPLSCSIPGHPGARPARGMSLLILDQVVLFCASVGNSMNLLKSESRSGEGRRAEIDLVPTSTGRWDPMAAGAPAVVVIADRTLSSEVARRLATEFMVWHSLPPAVFVVAVGGAAATQRLRRIPGVRAVLDPNDHRSVSDDVPDLQTDEALFVEAWLANARRKPKIRPGDTLAWDAPGRLPPDIPMLGE
jgi:hypothetical protein